MNLGSKFLLIVGFFIVHTVSAQTLEKDVRIDAPSLDGAAEFILADIWFPKGFNKDNSKQYRWIIYLHGSTGSSKASISRVISSSFEMFNAIDPPVVIMPDVFSFKSPAFNNLHLYANSQWHGKYEDIITKDIPNHLKNDAVFNLKEKLSYKKEHMGIGGFSAGGDGAIRIALRNPEMFQVTLVHSAAVPSLSDEVITELKIRVTGESCKTKPCDFSTANKFHTTGITGLSSAWGALDQDGNVRFLLDEQGNTKSDVVDEWRANYQPSTLIESQDLYKTKEGPYLYLETGMDDPNFYALFPQFVGQLADLQVPTNFYEWKKNNGGHQFNEERAVEALKFALEKMEDISTATKNYAQEFTYSVYPNPVDVLDETTVSFNLSSLPSNEVRLNVIDMIGRRVKSIAPSVGSGESNIKVDVSDLSEGIYMYQLQVGSRQATQKVIIQ